MGQWSDVNSLQNQITTAESAFKTLCNSMITLKAQWCSKREELKTLYAKQDTLIGTVLGPRSLYTDEKTVLDK